MRTLILATLCLALAATVVLGADAWWNKDYHFRVEAKVNTLFQERENAVVRAKVNFAALLKQAGAAGKLDPNSIRVIDPTAKEKPVVANKFITKDGAAGEVCWVLPGKVAALQERAYFIYFDTAANGPKEAPAPEDVLADAGAAGNLIKNPGFEEPDPKDPKGALGWNFGKGGATDEVCRTDEQARSGKFCLKIVTTPEQMTRQISQIVPVKEGKKHLVRCWVKSPDFKKGAAGLWVWYQFDKPRHKEYGNYKTSAGGEVVPEWTQSSASWINIQDKKTKEQRRIPGLMPGTVKAAISPSAYYGAMTVYIDDLEFIELADKPTEPVEVKFGKSEKAGG